MGKSRIYGEFGVRPADVMPARADRILGCRVVLDDQGRPDQVEMQFLSTNGIFQLDMDFLQAMFLLSVLKCSQLDTGTPFPDDPRVVRDNPLC